MPFRPADINRLMRRAERLVDDVMVRGTYARPAWDQLRNDLILYGRTELRALYDELVEREVRRRYRQDTTPPLLTTALTRAQIRWETQIQRAFATAHDSIVAGLRSIYSRVGRVIVDRAIATGTPIPDLIERPPNIYGVVRANRAVNRRITLRLIPYLRLLFQTTPRDFERDFMRNVITLFEPLALFRVVGGPLITTSCGTCRYAQDKVLTRAALDMLTSDRAFRVNLFHPHCRHAVRRVPRNYTGPVVDVAQLRRDARRHNLLR